MGNGWTKVGRSDTYSPEQIRIIKEAAAVDPNFAAKLGMNVGAASDYEVTEFRFGDIAANPKPGDDVFVDVIGSIRDRYAGFPDGWQVVVAVAAVDINGNPTALKDFKVFKSSYSGFPVPYSTTIKITDPLNPFHSHFVLGKMGSSHLSVWAQAFANHDDRPAWDWSLGQNLGQLDA